MSSFQDLKVFPFTITLWQKEFPAGSIELQDRERESMCIIPLGLCLRGIVNEKPLNLKKTTSGVLSVLKLIYDCR